MLPKVWNFSVFIFCFVQSTPVNVRLNQMLDEDIDHLLNRVQELLTLTENKIESGVQVLENFISGLVATAIEIRENGNKKLDEFVRLIEEAADQDVDISDCIGDNSIVDVETAAEDLEKKITHYTQQKAEAGVQQINSNIIDCNSQLNKVENCLVKAEECKLKEDIERAACTAQLSGELSRLESEVPKKTDVIITSSGLCYATVVDDLSTHTETYLNKFFKANLRIVYTFIVCANSKLPKPFSTRSTPRWPTSSRSTTKIPSSSTSSWSSSSRSTTKRPSSSTSSWPSSTSSTTKSPPSSTSSWPTWTSPTTRSPSSSTSSLPTSSSLTTIIYTFLGIIIIK